MNRSSADCRIWNFRRDTDSESRKGVVPIDSVSPCTNRRRRCSDCLLLFIAISTPLTALFIWLLAVLVENLFAVLIENRLCRTVHDVESVIFGDAQTQNPAEYLSPSTLTPGFVNALIRGSSAVLLFTAISTPLTALYIWLLGCPHKTWGLPPDSYPRCHST